MWTNRSFIHRDLSYAQGRLPVDVDCALTVEDKPPAPNVVEETEEEFFRNYVGYAELGGAGYLDAGGIKRMLDMVHDEETQQHLESDPETIFQISKLNPMSIEFIPNDIKSGSENVIVQANEDKPLKSNKRRCRNIAVQSILQSKEAQKTEQKTENSPSEIIVTNAVPVEKKHSLFKDRHNESNSTSNTKVILKLDTPSAMFKKKNTEKTNGIKENDKTLNDVKFDIGSVNVNPTNMFRRKEPSETSMPIAMPRKPANASSTYVPSIHADEYYKEYVKRSKIKTIIEEDVWAKAERQMREIDEKRFTQKAITNFLNKTINKAIDEALTRASIKASDDDLANDPIES